MSEHTKELTVEFGAVQGHGEYPKLRPIPALRDMLRRCQEPWRP